MKSRWVIFGLLIILILSLGVSVYTQYTLMQERVAHTAQIESLNQKIVAQRNDKNTIRDLWETQTALNDNLVAEQDRLTDKIEIYRQTVKKSIRFVNTVPEILPTISEQDLKNSESELVSQQTNLEEVTKKNTDQKQVSTDKIDKIYLASGEDQTNRANPNGIK